MGSAGLAGSVFMSEPYYRQVQADLRARIASGEFPPGTKLPSTRELLAFYREKLKSPTLATQTVRNAILLMVESGELRGQQGLGVFVPDLEEDDSTSNAD